MSTALTILLLTMTAGDADNVYAPAVVRATREAVGAETQISIRSLTAFPSDESAASLGAELHADAVVELSWSIPDELRVRLHLLRASTGRWTDVEIGFRAADAPAERARTVGFAVAAMFPEHLAEPTPAPPSPTPPPPNRVAVAPKSGESVPPPPAPNAPASQFTIDAIGSAALGTNDAGGSVGGALDFRWSFVPSIALRVGGALRVGEIPAAQITTQVFAGALGVAWEGWEAPGGRGGLGLRLDGLLERLDFSHLAEPDETARQDKWMVGADIVAEARWFFVPGAGIVTGAGAEALFGRTAVILGDRTFTTLNPVRPVVELGLRARF
jgi:hypothetical protein